MPTAMITVSQSISNSESSTHTGARRPLESGSVSSILVATSPVTHPSWPVISDGAQSILNSTPSSRAW